MKKRGRIRVQPGGKDLVRYTAKEMTNLVGELGGIQPGGIQPILLPKYLTFHGIWRKSRQSKVSPQG